MRRAVRAIIRDITGKTDTAHRQQTLAQLHDTVTAQTATAWRDYQDPAAAVHRLNFDDPHPHADQPADADRPRLQKFQ